ncbi:MAG TPA: gamma carbonic anhydrase family protein [Chloroflexota bacterium]|nr:gamma carbonic anhydrase family protein [Chloroflexota bacterium]
MPILTYLDHHPLIGAGVGLADDAYIVGQVSVAGPALLAAGAVLRGDQNTIAVGPRFHIGRGSTIHVESYSPTRIGSDVWLGDSVVVHACTLGDGVRVEDGGLVLSTSRVGSGSIVTAGSLVPEGAEFPEDSYIDGTPGRRVRATTSAEREETRQRVGDALVGAAER